MYREGDFGDGQVVVSEEARQLLRLADAIEAGCRLRPRQISGQLYDGADGACAWGASILGGVHWSQLDKVSDLLCCEVTWRNDGKHGARHTREEIAAWLRERATNLSA